ncbi:NucA/NucB deoxyribonuclease domain-containing protein [Streptomyces tubercidicus]|uniref:NucA/NucB deoxyribonuclease domain-containing protein n=1 Tax=Streptomyces tubercidicus TaxID=47759 RepID=UPI003F5BC043
MQPADRPGCSRRGRGLPGFGFPCARGTGANCPNCTTVTPECPGGAFRSKSSVTLNELRCDEYPLATSKEGLSADGQRRGFPGCSIPRVPSRRGAKGASACMISVFDQNYQGGMNSSFYRAERMLDGDPYRVLIGD